MISVVVPTRGRPESFYEMCSTIEDTAETKVEVVAVIDSDDIDSYDDILEKTQAFQSRIVAVVVPEELPLSNHWNKGEMWTTGEYVMLGADDLRFRTESWDTKIIETFETELADDIGLVYASDGSPVQGSLATHPIVTRRWIEAVGRWVPDGLAADWVDVYLTRLGLAIERIRYRPDVLIEHMHPHWGKGEWDATHLRRLARARAMRPDIHWEDAILPTIDADIERLRSAIHA